MKTKMAIVLSFSLPMMVETPGYAQPAPHQTDPALEHAIDRQLFEAPAIDANAIDVDVQGRVATLTGVVADILAKDRAVRIAQNTVGIISVEDRLRVKDVGRSDPNISADLLMAFASNPATDAWEIDTAIRDGEVTLTGTVQSAAESGLATRVAKSVRGVRNVANELRIEPRESRPDQQIEAEIEELLRWDVRIDDRPINVAVSDGRVALTGAVATAYEKELVMAHARAAGVADVDAKLLVVQPSSRTEPLLRSGAGNDAVAAAVERAIKVDPRVGVFALSATADDGTLTLTGIVDNLLAKRAAGELAESILGVERVLNFVKVRPELALTDEELANAARAALARDPIVAGSGITLLAHDAIVKLYGVVDTRFERAHATAVVGGINGVVDVENYLATYEALEDTPPRTLTGHGAASSSPAEGAPR